MATIHIIWAFNGGGIHGLLSAQTANRIEHSIGLHLAQIKNVKHWFIGTSTGGINAAALTKPAPDGSPQYAAEDVVKLYYSDGKTIFPRNYLRFGLSLLIGRGKYPASGIESVLQKNFGDTILGDHLHNLVLSATQTAPIFQPFFFKNYDKDDAKRKTWFAVRCSTAAPTYFPPVSDPTMGPDGCFIDGGVVNNDPAISGLAEALLQSEPDDEFIVVSFGTGLYLRSYGYKTMLRAPIWNLSTTVLDMLSGGQNYIVPYQMQELLNRHIPRLYPHGASGIQRFFNFDTMLATAIDSIDDASPKTLDALVDLANTMVDGAAKSDFDNLCQMLKKIHAGTFDITLGV